MYIYNTTLLTRRRCYLNSSQVSWHRRGTVIYILSNCTLLSSRPPPAEGEHGQPRGMRTMEPGIVLRYF